MRWRSARRLVPIRNLLKTESRRGYRLLGDWTVRRHDAAAASGRSAADAGRRRIPGDQFSGARDTPHWPNGGGGAAARPHLRLSSRDPDRTRRHRQNQPRLESRSQSRRRVRRRRLAGRAGVAVGSRPRAGGGGGGAKAADRTRQRHARSRRACHRGQEAAPGPRQLRAPHRGGGDPGRNASGTLPAQSRSSRRAAKHSGSQGEHVYRVSAAGSPRSWAGRSGPHLE